MSPFVLHAGGSPGPARIRVRDLHPDGAAHAVEGVFDGMSEQSRYLRFHTPMPRLNPLAQQRLIDLDGRERAAVVAEVGQPRGCAPIGIARLAGTGVGRAEMAVAVVDAWQRRGVGRRLLAALRDRATALGYRELYGDILPENSAMLGLVRDVFRGARTRRDDGVIHVTCALGRAALELTYEDLLADLVSE